MQRAATALARHAAHRLGRRGSFAASRIVILAGGGDNGGDALFAGAELARAGARVEITRTARRVHDAAFAAALAAGAVQLPDDDPGRLAHDIARADAILDGILGIGSGGRAAGGSPQLRGRAHELITAISRACAGSARRPFVIAVDLPSGIDPDSGEVPAPGAVLPADLTITFIGVKAGLMREPGRSFAGEVILEPLS